jgi:outer membrane protein insertion porin family
MPSRPGIVLLVLTLAVSLGAGATRAEPGSSADPTISAIHFLSDAPVDVAELRGLLPMREGDPLTAASLKEAERRLHLKGIFVAVRIDVRRHENTAVLDVHLQRRPVLNAVRFRGNENIGRQALLRAARLRSGTLLTAAMQEQAVEQVRQLYLESGFPAVQADAMRRRVRAGEVDVIVRVDEGSPLLIADVKLEGSLPVPAHEILERLDVQAGDRYVRSEERQAERQIVRYLRGLAHYEVDVETEWEAGAANEGVLRFTIDVGPKFDLQFSGNKHLSEKQVLRQVDLGGRPIITDGTWRELARQTRRKYNEDGYYFANVDVRVQAGSPKVVHYSIDEGDVYRVAALRFVGNRALSGEQLRAAMQTGPPSWTEWHYGFLLDDVLREDMERLRHLYRTEGFLSARPSPSLQFDAERGRTLVTVEIEEGPRTLVGELRRTGFDQLLEDEPTLATRVGDALNEEVVESDRRRLVAALAANGYADADVTVRIVTADEAGGRSATVTFAAVVGARQRVGTIIVQNNVDTRARVIRREIPFARGDILRPPKLHDAQRSIHRLGLFRSVAVQPAERAASTEPPLPADAETLAETDVLVNVSEKPAGTLQWGVGYNTRDGFRGFLEIGHANLQGLARRLSLRGEFNLEPGDIVPNEYLGNLAFREPRLWDTHWRLRTNLIAQRATRSVDQFSIKRVAFVPAIERDLGEGLHGGLEVSLEEADIFDLEPDVLAFNPDDEGSLTTVSFGPYFVYDQRDDPFAPRRGLFDSLRLRIAPAAFGSDVPFAKVQAQHRHYIPVLEHFTFLYIARLGWARPFRGEDILSIRERFFLGGRTTVRGFDENSIGPEGEFGDPLGGDLALNVNAEFWFPLLFGFGGIVFSDAGGVYLQEESIRIDDFRRSAGIGLRYMTPVGPIGLDYGFKLDKRRGESIGEIHFSIGASF